MQYIAVYAAAVYVGFGGDDPLRPPCGSLAAVLTCHGRGTGLAFDLAAAPPGAV